MELIIIIAALIGAFWWLTVREKALEESGRHPLDGNVTRKEPDLTTNPDGIGHQSIPVAPVLTQQTACGCGRSKTGYCVGLHGLSDAAWATHKDNPKAKKPRKPRAPKVGKSAADRVE
jgi:CDGSH-type Zn-finger protein